MYVISFYVQLICSWLQSEFFEKFAIENKDLVITACNFHKRVEQIQNETQKGSWLQQIKKKIVINQTPQGGARRGTEVKQPCKYAVM